MKILYALLGILLMMTTLTGCASAPLSALQRRSFEMKELEGIYDNAYKATLQVLQDHGYIIKNADYESGVIQGETGINMVLFKGMVNVEVTATLEQFGENTVKERLSLIEKRKMSTQYGTQESSKIIDDPELFQKIYDDIQKEMFVRQNLNR